MPLRDPFGMLFAGSIVSCRIVSPSLERSPTTRVGALGRRRERVVHKEPVDKKGNAVKQDLSPVIMSVLHSPLNATIGSMFDALKADSAPASKTTSTKPRLADANAIGSNGWTR